MTDSAVLLIEIGTEELPPRSLWALARALGDGVAAGLEEAGLRAAADAPVRVYATPRRLAVYADAVRLRAPDRVRERRGPALKAAWDDAGQPTPAALGFARSCHVAVADLEVLETDKGAWLVQRARETGELACDLVPGIVERAARALPIDRRMRWGDAGAGEFVRPVRWLVALHGAQVVPLRLYGVDAGNRTRGHRFHAPGWCVLRHAQDYETVLADAQVCVDFAPRRARVQAAVQDAARGIGGSVDPDDALLDEVTALTEWPVAVAGQFAPEFLAVPAEPLIACMQGHQRYFPVRDAHGALMAAFVAVANVESPKPEQVRAGFERVLRARLADARYFWDTDRAEPLRARVPRLAEVTFAAGLGTLADRGARLVALAGDLAGPAGADADTARHAATLAKADLLTAMVGEFPELQGVMGAHYARHDGEDAGVATALAEQYLPRFAGDVLPHTALGRVLALADRLDTLMGIFAVGQAPTGERDPFGLRRAALGVARILIETPLHLDLPALLTGHARAYPGGGPELVASVYGYVVDRLPAYYATQGIPVDVVDAVLARRGGDPAGIDQRVRALVGLRARPEAARLVAAHKRIANLLGQARAETAGTVDTALLAAPAEHALHTAVGAAGAVIAAATREGDFVRVCEQLAGLREPVDRFFEDVMVLCEDPALRANRLALLRALEALFADLGDLARLQLG